VPALISELESLPLNINGKIDRSTLPYSIAAIEKDRQYNPASTQVELELVSIWEELLKRNAIGIDDNFFEVGGHSLLATRVISAIRKRLNVEVGVRELFSKPTIRELSEYISVQGTGSVLPAVEALERPSRIPLSFSQERLWFIDQLQGTIAYHMTRVLRLKGDVDVSAIAKSLQKIVNRHEILRTRLKDLEGKPYQEVMAENEWQMSYIADKVFEGQEELRNFIVGINNTPFDLSTDHMLRAHLVKSSDGDYVLSVTLHHIVSDGWSMSVLIKEFIELYNSKKANRIPVLPVLPIQYADYAIWQRKYIDGKVLDRQLSYWKDRLLGTELLKLPTDHTRPSIQSAKGAVKEFNISKDLSEQLQRLSVKEGVTMYMLLLSAFSVLLRKYTGQEDICIGVPIANRRQQETEGLIGFFVNTLALRIDLRGNPTFLELLQRIKQITLEAYINQDAPFEKVVENVVKERDLSHHPLFQVMFTMQNTPDADTLAMSGVALSGESYKENTSKFDLDIDIYERSYGLIIKVEYCTDLFEGLTIERMFQHYQQLLESIIGNPSQKITALKILSGIEEHQLLVEFNNTQVQYPPDKTIVDLFEEQVRCNPMAVAVVFEDKELTYGELDEQTNRLAHYLRARGVGRETLVPICIERSLNMIVGILGILKAGGAYVPVDPEYPRERIQYMIENTGGGLIVTSLLGMPAIAGIQQDAIIVLDRDWETILQQPAIKVEHEIQSSDLAYVIYTSGSTGRPKGVMVEHGSIFNVSMNWRDHYEFDKCKPVLLSLASISFDVFTGDICRSLLNGGKLILVDSQNRLDMPGLYKMMSRHNVNVLEYTPAFVVGLVKYFESENLDVRFIKLLIVGSDSISVDDYRYLYEFSKKGIRLINSYGVTEATIDSSYFEGDLGNRKIVPVGRPMNNIRFYVLDYGLKPVPIGIEGDLYIGGAGVARGYLGKDDMTIARFKDVIINSTKVRLYYTGDRARWLPDGNIEYLGRQDDQVKIRGYRIELGEIEYELNKLPGVSASIVLAEKDIDASGKLLCFYTPDKEVLKQKETIYYQKQIAAWKQVYDEEDLTVAENEEFNITGWNDSFTGKPIPAADMQEWLSDIVKVILSDNATHVLEIGCGTGLIYYKLADYIKSYVGVDFSKACIDQIRSRIARKERDYPLTLLKVGQAHEVTLEGVEKVDTVVINSVIQYFPGAGYLNEVIGKSVDLLAGKGRIIIGDVRDVRLLKLFKGRLCLDKLSHTQSITEFECHVEKEVAMEEELCFSPDYFFGLKTIYPSITHVEIQWKQCERINEMSLYRYTVVLYVGVEKEVIHPHWQLWESIENKSAIIGSAEAVGASVIGIKSLPNPRLFEESRLTSGLESKLLNTVGDLLRFMGSSKSTQEELVNDLLYAARQHGYQASWYISADPLKMDLVLEKGTADSFIESGYCEEPKEGDQELVNIPLFHEISSDIEKSIRENLLNKLPGYMIPSEYVPLRNMPLTVNGKRDKKFLSEYGKIKRGRQSEYKVPETDLEIKVASIWKELLRIDKVSIDDNFFELGGHSLLAVRLVSTIHKHLKVEILIKDLFNNPTIKGVCEEIEKVNWVNLNIVQAGNSNDNERISI